MSSMDMPLVTTKCFFCKKRTTLIRNQQEKSEGSEEVLVRTVEERLCESCGATQETLWACTSRRGKQAPPEPPKKQVAFAQMSKQLGADHD